MRKISLCIGILLLLVAVSLNSFPIAHAAPGFVQQKAGASASTASTPCVYGTSPTKNNFLIVSFSWYPTTITVTSVTDTLLNTFTDAGVVTSGALTQTFKSDVWYANQAATTGADTITILLSSAPTFVFFTCLEFSQVQKTLRVAEKTATGTYTSGTSFTASVTSFTPTVTDLLYSYTGFMSCSATGTITYATATGFTAGTGKGTDAATSSTCKTSGSLKFQFNEADQYFPNTGTTATTAPFVVPDTAPTIGTGGWAEIVLELEFASFQSISQSITLASAKTNLANHPRALSQTVTDASVLTKVAAHNYGLAQSVTSNSSLNKVAAHFYSLVQSITSNSNLQKIANHFYSLAQSITINSLLQESNAFIKNLAGTILVVAIRTNLPLAIIAQGPNYMSFYLWAGFGILTLFLIFRKGRSINRRMRMIHYSIEIASAACMLSISALPQAYFYLLDNGTLVQGSYQIAYDQATWSWVYIFIPLLLMFITTLDALFYTKGLGDQK